MGLDDRDYMHEKKKPARKRGTGNRAGRRSGSGSATRSSPRLRTAPEMPDWKTILLGVSLAANVILLIALVVLHVD